MLNFHALRGTKDILPQESCKWQELENKARNFFKCYNYKEIRTPIIEELSLFIRSVGKATDIVQKEMYSFSDKGKRKICLRPEATASCVRAYLENSLHINEPLSKFYYIGPMFRAERPQAGRLRQFHQIGVEAMGSCSYFLDAEIISLLINLVKEFSLSRFTLHINSLGCVKDKKVISERFRELLSKKKNSLCDTCVARLEHNVLRVLDCKNTACQKTIRELPSTLDLICPDCRNHFEKLLEVLRATGINYEVDSSIVRGLDYYTGTVFELKSGLLGSQDAIAAGGRYDSLIESFGGPATGAVGFALGIERLLTTLEGSMALNELNIPLGLFIAALGNEAEREAFLILENLRKNGITCDMDYSNKSLKAKMRLADKLKARFVLIIGDDELKSREYILRDMSSSEQYSVKKDNLLEKLRENNARDL